ncbi:terpenoid synthase, partial [Pluteus cervinus]
MHPSEFPQQPSNPNQLKADIRKVIERFLAGCEVSLMVPLYDKEVHDACVAEAHRRGCFSKGDLTDTTLDRYIPMGVIMASATLSTIPRLETKAFMALFTALAVHVDDISSHNVEPLRRFTQNFLLRQPQGHPFLDAFAGMISDFPNHFDPLVSQIMLTSSLDFVTGQLMEHNLKGTPISTHAGQYADYVRLSSGLAHCYALSPFPRDLP